MKAKGKLVLELSSSSNQRGRHTVSIPTCKCESFSPTAFDSVAPLTREHGEYGSEGVKLEAVDNVAKVTHLDGHEDAPGGQQEDVQALGNNAQPQHSCGKIVEKKRMREREKHL